MGMLNAPSGFGIWVAFQSMIGSVDETIRRMKLIGAKWIAPRAGDGVRRDGKWSSTQAREAIQKYHAAGIKVFPWLYSYPTSYLAEVPILKSLIDEGADGIFLDCEIEWQLGNGIYKPAAEHYMQLLRKELGEDCFIGHAPFPYILWHLDFPYVEFGKYCDAVADQLYWSEINNDSAQKHIDRTQAQWDTYLKMHPEAAKVRCPIGVTYGHELKFVKNPPPGTFRPDDLTTFIEWCKAKDLPFYSVYSLDAACPDGMATLQKLAGASEHIEIPPAIDTNPQESDSNFDKRIHWVGLSELYNSHIELEDSSHSMTDEDHDNHAEVVQLAWYTVLIEFIVKLVRMLSGKKF